MKLKRIIIVLLLSILSVSAFSVGTVQAKSKWSKKVFYDKKQKIEYVLSNNGKEAGIVRCKSKKKKIIIPDYLGGKKVTTIGVDDYAIFTNASNIEEIIFPDTVTSFRYFCFGATGKLKKVKLSKNLVKIPAGAFEFCTSLKKIELPDKIKEISNSAFYGCRSLKEVTFSSACTKIGSDAFRECGNLSKINLKKIKKVGNRAFLGCTKLSEIQLMNVREIGIEAFKRTGVKKVTLGKKTIVGEGCFAQCYNLDSFVGNKKNDLVYKNGVFLNGKGDKLLYGAKTSDTLNIPEGVRTICCKAFRSNKKIKEINAPDTLEIIEDNAFMYCPVLEKVEAPGLREIGEEAFCECRSLKSISISAVERVGAYAFYECNSLSELIFSDMLQEINQGALKGIENLKTVYFPPSAKISSKVYG